MPALTGMGAPTSAGNAPYVAQRPRWQPMPRPPVTSTGSMQPQVPGYGTRSIWPLPPVGEAQRRDPHVPDPTPGGDKVDDQRNASPAVRVVDTPQHYQASPGDGFQYLGTPATHTFIKRIGSMMTNSLAKNWLSGIIESRWRVGGISYPPDYGFGPGYHGDAVTLYPDNPQVYLRNPGIIPLTNVPATWRYAPNGGIQPLGPSIADVGNFPAGAQSS